jgi:hypothetical protein
VKTGAFLLPDTHVGESIIPKMNSACLGPFYASP